MGLLLILQLRLRWVEERRGPMSRPGDRKEKRWRDKGSRGGEGEGEATFAGSCKQSRSAKCQRR